MKKQLLIAACGLLGWQSAQAQQQPENRLREPFALPRQLEQELAKRSTALAPAQSSTTVRKPGRQTIYQWSLTAWGSTPAVDLLTYDANGQVTQLVEQDSVTQRPGARYSWTYNVAGQQISGLQEQWSGTAWQNQSRAVRTFNAVGNLTEHLEQKWANGAWENVFRATVQYDSRNHYTGWSNEEWRNNAWVVTYAGRSAIDYNAAGAVTQETEDQLDPTTGTFKPGIRRQYTYPSPTSLLYNTRIDQQWVNGAYVNQQRIGNVVRDTQGREISTESELWVNGAWQLYSRFTNGYLANGSTQGLYEQWLNGAWVPQYRYAHTYDEWGSELGSVSEAFTNNAWEVQSAYRYLLRYNAAHDLLAQVRQNYDMNTRTYVNGLKITSADFRTITLGTQPNAGLAAATQLYPNPTTGRITLELAGLREPVSTEVVNGLGRVVQRVVLQPGQAALDLSAQPAGVYSVHLHTSAGLVVKKVVRQ